MRTRYIATAVIPAVLVAAVAGCNAGSTNWYAAGKAYAVADYKAGDVANLAFGATPRLWCTQDLGMWPVPVNGPLPGGAANPLANESLSAPSSGTSSMAGRQWISGCIAGYYQERP